MGTEKHVTLEKDQVFCKKGEQSNDLYYITQGTLMICSRQGRMVTPLAHVSKGEYFGELSFFDSLPRSADVIAIEPTTMIKIPNSEIKNQLPNWMTIVARQMSNKIRLMDEVISNHGIKKQNVESIKPLTIEQQRYYYEILGNEE